MDFPQTSIPEFEPRLKRIAVVVLAVVALIGLRLYHLQIFKGRFYQMFSEENSIREMPIPALRGIFWDRNGLPIVENRPAFDLILTPQYVVEPERVFETLEKNLGLSRGMLQSKWQERFKQPAYQPLPLLKDIPMDMVSWVKARKSPWGTLSDSFDLRGVDIRLRYEREYADDDVASHVLGYVREIDPDRLKAYQKKWPGRYRAGDQVGIRGLEEVWDEMVRGEDGYSRTVVNAMGREIVYAGMEEELKQKEAVNGKSLKLTLDARLQKAARDYFQGKAGAAVALDPKNGEVLLMYSAPSFDLNRLGREEGSAYWGEIASRPEGYLLNRAIQGAYPPGSTYKIVTATAAMQEGVVKPEEKIHCGGSLLFGNRAFGCWRSGGHGAVDFHRALVASCDVYFYTMGLRLGVDRLAKYADALGLGHVTGIGLPNERAGLIPTSGWKLRARKQPWQEGETLSIAIGQGYDLVTPLQNAAMVSAVVSGGRKITPHLVRAIVDPETEKETQIAPPGAAKKSDTALSPEVLERVRKALVGVVADPEGTAHRLSKLPIPMGGKTGTSQVVSLGKSCRGNLCKDHAWFVAFAPVNDPRIAVAVLVEHGGHGSSAAAPLAGELIKTYLDDGTMVR